jgi:hypothetical protein
MDSNFESLSEIAPLAPGQMLGKSRADARKILLVGGMGAMVPEWRREITELGLRSIVSGTIATCMSGAVAGLLVQ